MKRVLSAKVGFYFGKNMNMNSDRLKKVAKVVLLVLILTGVMQGISLAMKEVPTEDVPELVQPWWLYALTIISAVPWAALVGFGRNIWGYTRVYYRNGKELEYIENKLKETLALYGGIITTIMAVATYLPDPYDKLLKGFGTAVFVIIDLIFSEIRHYRETET